MRGRAQTRLVARRETVACHAWRCGILGHGHAAGSRIAVVFSQAIAPVRRPRPQPPPTEVLVRGTRLPSRDAGADRMQAQDARGVPGTFGEPLQAVESLPGISPMVSGLAVLLRARRAAGRHAATSSTASRCPPSFTSGRAHRSSRRRSSIGSISSRAMPRRGTGASWEASSRQRPPSRAPSPAARHRCASSTRAPSSRRHRRRPHERARRRSVRLSGPPAVHLRAEPLARVRRLHDADHPRSRALRLHLALCHRRLRLRAGRLAEPHPRLVAVPPDRPALRPPLGAADRCGWRRPSATTVRPT